MCGQRWHIIPTRHMHPNVRKWNESGFRPPLCTYRLNWARRTSWGWWDDWDDTVLQTQDSKFEPWRSEAEHATSRSRRLPTILTFTRGWGRNIFVSFKPPRPGTEPRALAWKAAVLTTTLGPPPPNVRRRLNQHWQTVVQHWIHDSCLLLSCYSCVYHCISLCYGIHVENVVLCSRYIHMPVPAHTRRWINVGLTLVHRLRRWPNIKTTLIKRIVSAGV